MSCTSQQEKLDSISTHRGYFGIKIQNSQQNKFIHTHQHTALKKFPVNYIIVVINIKLAVFIVLFMILNEVF